MNKCPGEALVDGGYSTLADIDVATRMGTTVYVPVPEPKDESREPFEPLPTDTEHVASGRRRMGTEEAKLIYKDRAATAECVNALARNRGLRQFLVRGLAKVEEAQSEPRDGPRSWPAVAHRPCWSHRRNNREPDQDQDQVGPRFVHRGREPVDAIPSRL